MRIFMLGSTWQSWTDLIFGIFAIIPQSMYFLYTCCASLLDFFQFLVRKLVGLDVYYIDNVAHTGDLLSEIINNILGINNTGYSALRTVFWSLVIFGLILIVITTIISIIKSHFNYDAKKSQPMAIVFSSIKSAFMVAIVPIMAVFGLYLSNVILKVLDEITSPNSTSNIVSVYEGSSKSFSEVFQEGVNSRGETTYASFDLFGNAVYSDSISFSGVLFKLCAKDCNRIRYGSYTAELAGSGWSDFGIFNGGDSDSVALKIDTAFANCLTLKNPTSAEILKSETWPLLSSYSYLGSATFSIGLINVQCFSKFNVGLVWYYYNLWTFNLLLGMIGIITTDVLLFNICFGLTKRLIQCVALFMVYPPLVGISPLDDAKAMKKWNKEFISNAVIGITAVVSLNLCFLVLPYFQNIKFFTSDILNGIMDVAIIIVALMGTKKIIALTSNIIGTKNAENEGSGLKDDVKKTAFAGADMVVKAAKVGADIAMLATGAGALAAVGKKAVQGAVKKEIAKQTGKTASKKATENLKGVEQNSLQKVDESNLSNELYDQNEDIEFMSEEQARLEYDNTVLKMDNLREKINEAKDVNKFGEKLREYSLTGDMTKARFSSKQKVFINNLGIVNDITRINDDLSSGKISTQEAEVQREKIYRHVIDDYAEVNNYTQLSDKEIEEYEQNIKGLRKRLNILDDRRIEQKRVRKGQNVKEALLNIGDKSLKVVGNISIIKELLGGLRKNTSASENLKEIAQKFYQMTGNTAVVARAKAGEGKLATTKQKEQAEKMAVEMMGNENLTVKKELLNQSKAMLRQIEELKKKNNI